MFMALDRARDTGVDELLAAAAARLQEEADEYGDRVAVRVHEEIGDFPFPAAVTPQTRAAVRSTLIAFLEMARSPGRSESPRLPADAVAYARAFVQRRVPVVILLRTYLLGYRELWRSWAAAIRAGSSDEALQLRALDAGADVFFSFIDGLTTGIVEVFETEQAKWSRSLSAIRTELVEAILDEKPVDVAEAERAFLYRLGESHLGVVVWSSADPQSVQHDRLEQTWQQLAQGAGMGQSLVVYAGRRVIWGWFGGPHERVAKLADTLEGWEIPEAEVGVAIGEPGEGQVGFRDTHRQALHARRVAVMGGRESTRVARFKRLAVPALASIDPSLSSYFVRHQLGRLAGDSDLAARLRGTLETYFEERESAAATGRRLGIHSNTVTYRLRQIEELLGYPPDEQRLELQLALRLIRYVGSEDGTEARA